ncbi:MAG: prepilin-type N-terminal cleavage/methylation domain-containing protein [Elusimicrobia bacterium]|nr:prepilin-type N-terminal cleavage/methylation domain-containing protein [Candidatus Liberimonas magnetica]
MKNVSIIKIKPDNSSKGVTLVEMIMAVAIFGVVLPLVTVFLMKITTGFSTYEMTTELRKTNQQTSNRVYMRLNACKRLFQNNASGNAYLAKVSLTGCPALLTGSQMPTIEETGSLVLGNAAFVAASVGNCLFFAGNDSTAVLLNILNSSAQASTVRIDTYRFYYYYLSPSGAKSVGGKPAPKLTEWQSKIYADYNQIAGITDPTKKSNTITALINQEVLYAWDSSNTDPAASFYTLAGGAATLAAGHSIVKEQATDLTSIISGAMGSNYSYGYSPNSSSLTKPPKTVPIYATASGDFPSGFEVAIVAQAAGRMVLIRSVLIAKESTHEIVGDELHNITCVRDLW